MNSMLTCENVRRFGAEIEILSFDRQKKAQSFPPLGSNYVANLISKSLETRVEIQKYGYNDNNDRWILKPDSSCGLEVSSPVLKGYLGLSWLLTVVDEFNKDSNIKVDESCSLHVHVDVSDLTDEQVGVVIASWIKCEPVFMDAMISSRKKNKYCQFIGQATWLTDFDKINPYYLIQKLSEYKYYSLSTYHYVRGNRKTLEFRIMSYQACKDAFLIKSWIRLILHFVETTKYFPFPGKGEDIFMAFKWLDPNDVLKFLKLLNDDELSLGLKQVKDWFILSLFFNVISSKRGVWSENARVVSIKQIKELFESNSFILDDSKELIFGDKYRS